MRRLYVIKQFLVWSEITVGAMCLCADIILFWAFVWAKNKLLCRNLVVSFISCVPERKSVVPY